MKTFKEYEDVDSIPKSDSAGRRAFEAINVLLDRRGFDDWWGDIDSEDREEIFEELRAALKD